MTSIIENSEASDETYVRFHLLQHFNAIVIVLEWMSSFIAKFQ